MSFLAIDLGASSGRAVIGTLHGAVMRMEEVHRFRTPMIEADGHLSWDIAALWAEVKRAVEIAFARGPLRSISVDSWAVDYVPLGTDGEPLRDPYAYRDPRTSGRMETAIQLAGGADALYDRTGIQFLSFNTLPQVIADIEDEPDVASATATRLHIAEYLLYRLSGIKVAERTMASTTQLVDARSGEWSSELIDAIADAPHRWPDIVPSGTVLGPLLADLVPDGVTSPPAVIASCSHDTAAAVAAVPAAMGRQWAFISSGTWSLVGAELCAPVLTRAAREAGFTNEAGIDGTVRFLANRAGMWVLEECRRQWEAEGWSLSHDALFDAAAAVTGVTGTIDLNAPQFAERGDMPRKIADACAARGIATPSTHAGIARLIVESLAESHADALARLERVTGLHVEDVYVVGGGALNDILSQRTADRTGRRVLAGPAEATVLGNLLVQARTLGGLPNGVSIRDASRCSSSVREFLPSAA